MLEFRIAEEKHTKEYFDAKTPYLHLDLSQRNLNMNRKNRVPHLYSNMNEVSCDLSERNLDNKRKVENQAANFDDWVGKMHFKINRAEI